MMINDFMAGYQITLKRKLILNERLGHHDCFGENCASVEQLLMILWQGIELYETES